MIKRSMLIDAAKKILNLASQYKGQPHREMRIDGLVYGVLHERFNVVRQYHVRTVGRTRPKRIDFRQGGENPIVIEFAMRTEDHRSTVYGPSNRSELHKLERQNKAKARYLLLLDVSKKPLTREALKKSFDGVARSRGRGAQMSVRVVYVHPEISFHFLWSGRK